MKGLAIFILSVALASACKKVGPQGDIIARGGPDPIACIDRIKNYRSYVRTCRDGRGVIWACALDEGWDCIPLNVLNTQWQLPQPEAVNAAH